MRHSNELVVLALFAALLTACAYDDGGDGDSGPGDVEPPRIASMDPQSGDYGTVITIEGEHLLGSGSFTSSHHALPRVVLTRGDDQSPTHRIAHDDQRIEFLFSFPHEGPVIVETDGGSVEAGTFTPSMVAGEGLHIEERVVDSWASPSGRIVLLVDNATDSILQVIEFADGIVREQSFDRGSEEITAGSLFSVDAETVAGVIVDGDREVLYLVEDEAGWSLTPSSIIASRGVVAAAVDDDGPLLWVLQAEELFVRVRPEAEFAIDRGPIAAPEPLDDAPALAVAPDQTLWLVFGDTRGVFDTETYAIACQLLPDADVFTDCEEASGGIDDYIRNTRLEVSPTGDRVRLEYCADDGGLGSDGLTCGRNQIRGVDGAWRPLRRLIPENPQIPVNHLTFTRDGFAALVKLDGAVLLYANLELDPELEPGDAEELPLYPASPFDILRAEDDSLHFLVCTSCESTYSEVFAPRPR